MKKFFLMILSLVLFIPFQVSAQDDLFQVKTPNVMVIFDTSDSMNMSVNVNAQGTSIWTNKFGPDNVTQFVKDGNHPDSKLYQAKKALAQIIDEVVKDRVNLGFSTYAQQKIERRRGQYTRAGIVTQEEGWRRYKRYYLWDTTNDTNPRYATSTSSNSFVDAWSITRSNVTAHATTGTEFNRAISIHDKSGPLHPTRTGGTFLSPTFATLKAYTITYRVTARTHNPETNVYTFTYIPVSPAYDRYREAWSYDISILTTWSTTAVVCGGDTINTPFPSPSASWKTYFAGESEYVTPSNNRNLTYAAYSGTQTWWACAVQYRAKITQDQFTWSTTTGTSCAATVAGTPVYNLVPGTCFDWSGYEYLADGTVNKPHTWAYHKITASKWKKSDQPDPFYPALAGDPGVNPNNFFFINFPDDKDSNFKTSDRTVIKNKILSFLDLTPVKFPQGSIPTGSGVSEGYWTKLPIQAINVKTGLTANTAAAVTQRQTPLADSLNWAFTYFDDYINEYNGGDPSSKEKFGETLCRGNYIILLTDGLESAQCTTGPCGIPATNLTPNYNAAVTESATLLTKNVKTFVIGFGGDIVGNQTLTNIAVAGGTNKAYFATNLGELKSALASIFQAITGQYYGRSNPVITRARDRLYRGNFDVRDGDWLGHLMAWDADMQTGVLAPDFAWDSGEKLTILGRGTVYTWTDAGLNPARKQFSVGETSLYPLVNPLNEDIDGVGGVTVDDAKTVINFTLLPEYDSGKYKGKRALNVDIRGTAYPSWKLGDIYHSTPVVIGEPAFSFKDNDYTAFYDANKNREMMIYVGTNDGMLHGFKNSDGTEVFSIIPKNLLGKLKGLKEDHYFYVDASPKAYDVYFKDESKWKTVLITGQRSGGPYYFAVDVTQPNDPKILWELTHGNMGDTWAKPDIGKIKDGGETKFAAFLSGGYSPSTTPNKGNSFYIVDIETGTILKSFTVGDSTNRIPSAVNAFDADEDGYIDYIYFGDIQGTLWKVDVRSSNKDNWTLYEFFKENSPTKRRPIFHPPAAVKNNEGKILVFFGTGDELGLAALTKNYFYEVEDEGATGKESWSKTLEDGEKVLASPAVLNNVVYFTTWVYKATGDFCGAGEGRLWGLKVSKLGQNDEGEAGLVTLDTATGKWKAPQQYISLGAGIPSAPIVTNGMVYIGTSLNANRVIQIPVPPMAVARIKSWREVVR